MMKLFRVALLALTLPLAACAGSDFSKITSVLTAQVSNPITNNELQAILQAHVTATRIALKYLKLPTCAVGRAAWPANNCGDYQTRLSIKKAIADASPVRKELIRFVRENNTVNARVAYDELQRIIAIMNQVRGN